MNSDMYIVYVVLNMLYLIVHIPRQAALVSKYQTDDALQYGATKGVDAKHQGTKLLRERRVYLETKETKPASQCRLINPCLSFNTELIYIFLII